MMIEHSQITTSFGSHSHQIVHNHDPHQDPNMVAINFTYLRADSPRGVSEVAVTPERKKLPSPPKKKRIRKLVLARGEWIPTPEDDGVNVDADAATELLTFSSAGEDDQDDLTPIVQVVCCRSESESPQQQQCNRTFEEERDQVSVTSIKIHSFKNTKSSPNSPTQTNPTYQTISSIEYNANGRPECIYVAESDEWSISTLGSSIAADARAGKNRTSLTNLENLMTGTF